MPVLNVPALIEERVSTISAFHRSISVPLAQLDVSGGIDSAVMLGLLCQALGPDAVTAVYSSIQSSDESRARAQAVADVFGCKLIAIDLSDIFDRLVRVMVEGMKDSGRDADALQARIDADPTIIGSIRSTLRAPVGRGFNRLSGGGIRHGTGNECEDRFIRFYQKGGDGEVDTNPIAMLSKGEVYQLARGLDVPASIIEAMPTPDLWGVGEGHNDEDELVKWTGVDFTYSRISMQTGEYTKVGSIERVSRFLDDVDDRLFSAPEENVPALLESARKNVAFEGLEPAKIDALCLAARRVERITRHKLNPSATPLGSRQKLLDAGLITNRLP